MWTIVISGPGEARDAALALWPAIVASGVAVQEEQINHGSASNMQVDSMRAIVDAKAEADAKAAALLAEAVAVEAPAVAEAPVETEAPAVVVEEPAAVVEDGA